MGIQPDTTGEPDTAGEIVFDELPPAANREGYLKLSWSELETADAYQLSDASGAIVYQGRLPKAFVSGLPDGEHEFQVVALDRSGQRVGHSRHGVSVVVSHWPMAMTWSLFGVGAVMTVSLFLTLAVGVARTRRSDEEISFKSEAS